MGSEEEGRMSRNGLRRSEAILALPGVSRVRSTLIYLYNPTY